MSKHKFILSDESINAYGFRVMTDGIDTEDFEKNPVMFYNHNSWGLPIGRWDDVEKKDGKLIATAVFDAEDELAKQIESKVNQKILNACSIGFDVMETSVESVFLLQGQTRPTITKAKLFECSIVGVPANANAIKLRNNTALVELSATGAMIADLLPVIADEQNQNSEFIKELGFKDKDELQKFIKSAIQKEEEALIELGRSKGIVNSKNEAHFRQLAKNDAQTLMNIFKNTDVNPVSFSKIIQKDSKSEIDPREKWTFDDWSKNDPNGLMKMKREDPERYKELVKNYR